MYLDFVKQLTFALYKWSASGGSSTAPVCPTLSTSLCITWKLHALPSWNGRSSGKAPCHGNSALKKSLGMYMLLYLDFSETTVASFLWRSRIHLQNVKYTFLWWWNNFQQRSHAYICTINPRVHVCCIILTNFRDPNTWHSLTLETQIETIHCAETVTSVIQVSHISTKFSYKRALTQLV